MTQPARAERDERARLPAPVLALDFGGTQLRAAVVLADGHLRGRRSARTPKGNADEVVAACTALLKEALREASADPDAASPVALGISAPGPLDPIAGRLTDPPNLDRSLWNYPFAAAIGEEIGLPAVLERDTQVAALAEGSFGAARGLTDYVYLTVSTGIGGAVVSDGRLIRGPDRLAGELGHLTIDINGPACGCGARGHLEGIASGTGIARAAREAGLTGREGAEVEARDVAEAEDRGDVTAARIMDRARQAFAAAAVSIVDVFNPQRIVVGGGIATAQGDRLLEPARQGVRQHAFRRQAERVDIVLSALGDDVGLVGALSLVALAQLGDDGNLQHKHDNQYAAAPA